MKKLELLQLKREIEDIISDKISSSPIHSRSGSQTSSSHVDSSRVQSKTSKASKKQ
jgi:hypothetical protein